MKNGEKNLCPETALERAGSDFNAPEQSFHSQPKISVAATRGTVAATLINDWVERLREFMAARGLGQLSLGRLLHIQTGKISAWLRGGFPRRQYWPALIVAGVATEAELREWRPARRRGEKNAPRPASWFIRNAHTFSLSAVARAYRQEKMSSADAAAVAAGRNRAELN